MKIIRVTNMTSLFSKEMLIYSFFDIRLKSPLRVMAILYFMLLFGVIGIPILIVFWPPNVYSLMFAFGTSIGGAIMMSKPIWNGKSFISFAKAQFRYFMRPRVLYDWVNRPKETVYTIDNEILVSRHSDYGRLYRVVKEEEI